jgi:cyclase
LEIPVTKEILSHKARLSILGLTIRQLSNSVTVFEGRHPLGVGVTATVVRSGREALVFDSLLYPEDSRELLHNIKEYNVSIKGLINTHWHWDHTAGNQLFSATNRIISHSLSSYLMRKFLNWDDLNEDLQQDEKIRTVYPNESVADGFVFEVGRQEVEFLHTPGHTPDSIAGWLRSERIVIAGDTVMELPYLWYGDSRALIDSLMRLRSVVGSGRMIQGHGGTCPSEKVNSDVKYIESLLSLVGESFNSGKSVEEAKTAIKLADCVSKERLEITPTSYEGVHSKNVGRIYAEVSGKAA